MKRGKGTDTEKGGMGAEQDFSFLVGLHANTLECIVQLRELKKRCIIQVRGMETGKRREGGRGHGRERDEGKAHQKKNKEVRD